MVWDNVPAHTSKILTNQFVKTTSELKEPVTKTLNKK